MKISISPLPPSSPCPRPSAFEVPSLASSPSAYQSWLILLDKIFHWLLARLPLSPVPLSSFGIITMPTNPAGRLSVGRSFRELIWEWRRVQWSQNKLLVEKVEGGERGRKGFDNCGGAFPRRLKQSTSHGGGPSRGGKPEARIPTALSPGLM